ncbi:MAG: Gfo/Idh/MocA family oxidoreductase, partial [Lentisphaeria bacterium]|nr:Gfo/Idh/MocA family oxidoreductase [Lentisphaeria bacterium]
VVVIGYGFSGKSFHSYLVSLVDDLELYGIASRNPETRERIVAERSCKAFASYDDVLDDPQVDIIVLATPNNTHADMAIAALNKGKHLVTDKVMCLTLADCDRMIQCAKENKRHLFVFQNRRWDGDYLTLKDAMDKGELGDVRSIEMAWQGFGAWGGWRGEKASGGGKLYDLGAHIIDQICMLFPEPIDSVYAKLHYDLPVTDTESQAYVTINFKGGRTGICDTSSLAAISKPRMAAYGTKASFIKYGLDPQEKAMIDETIDAAVEAEENYARIHDGTVEIIRPTLAGRWRNFYENVADVITNGAESAIQLGTNRRAMSVIDAAFRSHEEGKLIHLNYDEA